MSHALIARQPIFDGSLQVYGYELLYRASTHADCAEPDCGDQATSSVLIDLFTSMDMERLLGGRPAFVNVTGNTLRQLADHPVAPGCLVAEVLEDVRVDAEAARAVQRLVDAGVGVALDDFLLDTDHRCLAPLADFVKVDIQALSRPELERHARELSTVKARLIAEKVETAEEWALCRRLGFDLFQGFFFARPQTVSRRRLPTDHARVLHLVARLQDPAVSLAEVTDLVVGDVSLSYRLLRLSKAAYGPGAGQVGDVHEAIRYLGVPGLRTWVTWIAVAGIDDKPAELKRLTLARAQMARLMAPSFGVDGDQAFLAGLFSTLDALMDAPMAEAVGALPVSGAVRAALVDGEGPLARLLAAVRAYERGQWPSLAAERHDLGELSEAYLEALDWAEGISESL